MDCYQMVLINLSWLPIPPLQCDSKASPIKSWSLSPHLLSLGWPDDLLWPINCNSSNIVPVLILHLKTSFRTMMKIYKKSYSFGNSAELLCEWAWASPQEHERPHGGDPGTPFSSTQPDPRIRATQLTWHPPDTGGSPVKTRTIQLTKDTREP